MQLKIENIGLKKKKTLHGPFGKWIVFSVTRNVNWS